MFDRVRGDLQRLSPGKGLSARAVVAGVLSQGFQAIVVYRFFNWLHRHRIPGQPLRFFCERFVEITAGISIPAACTIGKGLRIHHFGGIIFHPSVVLGEGCTVYHGVTIGDRGGSGGAAVLGNNVLVGAGAKIIGPVTIGDDCVIGANVVVTKNLPPGTTALGAGCRLRYPDGRIE
ncbi:serine acetyltransferase [Geomonas sp. RF6]|uniref:serine O-acetyltransferase n=1 Tax=Geomonas sp. RF6 TaxID=2897342 RepID=UPI001E3F69C3|nr:DapH/DapD/GlmU-related protein [Geomonas sp. RF6]UFS69126.1 serine acetyltransferase [Geomonas sp. RF6]